MTWQRDLAWRNIEASERAAVAYQLARYASTLKYDLLPPEVVHAAKRCLLDAMGCCIGAYHAPGRLICERLARGLGGVPEATLFATGEKMGVLGATLANSFLVRYLDYNDMGGGGHNSDSIPGIIAVAESEKKSGRDLLLSLVLSYELGARVTESADFEKWAAHGFTMDARGGLSVPPAVGILMGLTEDQIVNATGLCASHAIPINILDADKEANNMGKNLRFGWVVHDAIMACLLAREGFTGPARIIEGDSGFRQVVLQGEMDMNKLTDFSGWRILKTRFKYLCFNGSTHSHVSATLAIVKENDLHPRDIAAVHIRATSHEAAHTAAIPAKKYPRDAENADHSAHFLNAVAIKERVFTPDTFGTEKYTDPVILDLIEKITVEADRTLPDHSITGVSEIITTDGRRFTKRVDQPHGYGTDPLTDAELEQKFRDMAVKYMGKKQIDELIDMIWTIDKSPDITRLTGFMAIPAAAKKKNKR